MSVTLHARYQIQGAEVPWEQRVVFEPFDVEDDTDPKSHKVGICTYCRLLALILWLFGKTIAIPVEFENGEIKELYLNKNSLMKWLKRHGHDVEAETDKCVAAIQAICNKHLGEYRSHIEPPLEPPSAETTDADVVVDNVVKVATPRKIKKVDVAQFKAAREERQLLISPTKQKRMEYADDVLKHAARAAKSVSIPTNLFRDMGPSEWPNSDGVYYFGAKTSDSVVSIRRARAFPKPEFEMIDPRPSYLGLGLHFFSERDKTGQLGLLTIGKHCTFSVPAKLNPAKVAYITNYQALQTLRESFAKAAKTYLEARDLPIQRAHLGDAMVTHFFTSKRYDAFYLPELSCITLFDPTKAEIVRRTNSETFDGSEEPA